MRTSQLTTLSVVLIEGVAQSSRELLTLRTIDTSYRGRHVLRQRPEQSGRRRREGPESGVIEDQARQHLGGYRRLAHCFMSLTGGLS